MEPRVSSSKGCSRWCLFGDLHREDGPAVEHANGYKEYWINGRHYFESEFKIKKEKANEKTT
jgi:hypothetical protein